VTSRVTPPDSHNSNKDIRYEDEKKCSTFGVYVMAHGHVLISKDLVTSRELWLPARNRTSRAPTGNGLAEQIILAFLNFGQPKDTSAHCIP
jgi:hypothetical protein